MNILILTGNLGSDPELKVTPEGTAVTKFSLAVRDWSPKKPDGVLWFNIVCWDKLAETAEKFLAKGDKVTVQGRVAMRPYTDRNGIDRVWVEIVARELELPARPRNKVAESQGSGYNEADWIPDYAEQPSPATASS